MIDEVRLEVLCCPADGGIIVWVYHLVPLLWCPHLLGIVVYYYEDEDPYSIDKEDE